MHVAKIARPLYPQFGLEPNVYYIPPVHVPPSFLSQMFGAGVEQAIATYRAASQDRKLIGALLLFGATPQIIHHYRVEGSFTIGYDDSGAELVRVPFKEPIFMRVAFDEKYQTRRSNMT